jgi:two-component system chemotaxis response regulator CheB
MMGGSLINVLVVDDSAFMRKVISDILTKEPGIDVVGVARDGQDAIDKVKSLRPDVITLDVEMPKMDGLTALTYIMKEFPTPTVMLSALTKHGADETIKALEYGAVDFIPKPSGSISLDIDSIKDEIVTKVRAAAKANIGRIKIYAKAVPRKKRTFKASRDKQVVVIGSSTGGPPALLDVLPRIPKNFPAGILVVQHMPAGFTKSLSERLDTKCAIHVKEAKAGDKIKPGTALVAPGNYHLLIENSSVILDEGPKIHGVRPSVDLTMMSAAELYRNRAIGVIMTGMGSDGADGMKMIKKRGGRNIAQDEDTSTIFGMPKAAIKAGCVDVVVPLDEIHENMIEMAGG